MQMHVVAKGEYIYLYSHASTYVFSAKPTDARKMFASLSSTLHYAVSKYHLVSLGQLGRLKMYEPYPINKMHSSSSIWCFKISWHICYTMDTFIVLKKLSVAQKRA
jgi:hypothetical protein